MAEVIGLGASLLSIAAFGATVVTTLRVFVASYSNADQKVTDLSTDVSLTASILTELGNTVKEYEVEFHLKADNFANTKESCERNFRLLSKALKDAKKGFGGDIKLSKKNVMSSWEKLKFALGGEANLKELAISIETSKTNLQLLLDSVNLLILKKLNKKHLLNEDQAEDLKLLVNHLPILLKGLYDAGLVKAVFGTNQDKNLTDTPSALDEKLVTPNVTSIQAEPEVLVNESKSINDYPVNASISKNENVSQNRKSLDEESPKVLSQLNTNTAHVKVNDVQSPPSPPSPPHLPEPSPLSDITPLKKNPLPEVIYESWLLTHTISVTPTTRRLFFLTLKTYPASFTTTRTTTIPSSVNQPSLLGTLTTFASPSPVAEAPSLAQKLLLTLDPNIQHQISLLLTDRNQFTLRGYVWSLAAIIDQSPNPRSSIRLNPFSHSIGPKLKPTTQLLLIIQSSALPDSEKGLHNLLASRVYDPWKSIADPYPAPKPLPTDRVFDFDIDAPMPDIGYGGDPEYESGPRNHHPTRLSDVDEASERDGSARGISRSGSPVYSPQSPKLFEVRSSSPQQRPKSVIRTPSDIIFERRRARAAARREMAERTELEIGLEAELERRGAQGDWSSEATSERAEREEMLEAELERFRTRRGDRRGDGSGESGHRSGEEPAWSAASRPVSTDGRKCAVDSDETGLLSQEEAEKAMDAFLATFTD